MKNKKIEGVDPADKPNRKTDKSFCGQTFGNVKNANTQCIVL